MPRSGFLAETGRAGRRDVAPVLAGQPAAPQRRPGQDADALVEADLGELELDGPLQQVVLRLQRDDGGQAEVPGQQGGLLQLPADEVADPAYWILPARTASSKNRKVSSIGVSGSQACAWYRSMVSTPSRARLASSARVRRTRDSPTSFGPLAPGEAAFGGDHHPVARPWPGREPAPDDRLRLTIGVDVGGVDEVAALFHEAVELFVGDLLVALGPEGHRAQAQRGHHRAGVPQRPVLHRSTPPSS